METRQQFEERVTHGSLLALSAGVFGDMIQVMIALRIGPGDVNVLGTLEMPRDDYPLLLTLLELGANQIPNMKFHHKLACGRETYDSDEAQRRNRA